MSLQLLLSQVLEEHISGTSMHKSHGQLIFFSYWYYDVLMRSLRAMESCRWILWKPVNHQQFEYRRTVDSLRSERPARLLSPIVKNKFSWTLVHALHHTSGPQLLLEPKVLIHPYCPQVGHLLHFPWRGSASFPSGKGKIWGYPGHYWAFPL